MRPEEFQESAPLKETESRSPLRSAWIRQSLQSFLARLTLNDTEMTRVFGISQDAVCRLKFRPAFWLTGRSLSKPGARQTARKKSVWFERDR